jgi:hypothetical protein
MKIHPFIRHIQVPINSILQNKPIITNKMASYSSSQFGLLLLVASIGGLMLIMSPLSGSGKLKS